MLPGNESARDSNETERHRSQKQNGIRRKRKRWAQEEAENAKVRKNRRRSRKFFCQRTNWKQSQVLKE